MTVRVFDAGLACCAVEVGAALRRLREVTPEPGERPGGPPSAGTFPGSSWPRAGGTGPARTGPGGTGTDGTVRAGGEEPAREGGAGGNPAPGTKENSAGAVHVLVIAGTVTDKLAPFVLRAFQETPEPRRVLSFGACSNSGGPYWDSYCVTKGADQLVPVDLYIPGCPPRPEALLDGLRALLEGRQNAPGGQGNAPAPGPGGPP